MARVAATNRVAASGRVASTRVGNTFNILPNGNFSHYPAVITAPTNTVQRWINGTAAGGNAVKGTSWATPQSGSGVGANGEAGFDASIFRTAAPSMKLSNLNASGAVTITNYRNNPSATTLHELFTLKPSTAYVLTAYIRTNNVPTNGAFIDLRQYDAAGATVATTSTNKLAGTDTSWRTVTASFTTGSTTRFGSAFQRLNVPGNTCDAWFDDITLVETAAVRVAP